ncbi:histone H4 [Micractinium conductrix]|uniref:Histone H4 n=1 Tax=Micractinium conductrix TaxID=554055 RepID=A0A2P6VEA6_9CHLO|nr:histone H4 [Micractinium conductrix]|eukprot:PSC72401.1 histone H4 [Micractinium conductrix]
MAASALAASAMAAKQKNSRKDARSDSSTGRSAVGLLAVAAAAAGLVWWWRKRHDGDAGKPGDAGRSAFKFPAGAAAAGGGGKGGKGKSNKKKDKAQRREEKAQRAEKRDKAAAGPQPAEKEQPTSASVINYSYYDSARRDGIMPAAKKRANLTAADAVALQQDAAADKKPRMAPAATPTTGRGRAGQRRSTGKSSCKRRLARGGLPGMGGVTRNDLKRLARRAGVIRIADACFESVSEALKEGFLTPIIQGCIIMAEGARRHTVIANDVLYVLKQRMGRTLYIAGASWNYNYYMYNARKCLKRVRDVRVSQTDLAAAAEARTSSQMGCHSPAAAAAARVQRAEEVAAPAEEQQEAHEAAVPGLAEVEQPTAAGEQHAATGTLSPAGQEAGPADVPTPTVMSVERMRQVQAFASEVLTPAMLGSEGCMSSSRFLREMRMKGCSPAEVRDVLFVLEKNEAIMMSDDGAICPCQ